MCHAQSRLRWPPPCEPTLPGLRSIGRRVVIARGVGVSVVVSTGGNDPIRAVDDLYVQRRLRRDVRVERSIPLIAGHNITGETHPEVGVVFWLARAARIPIPSATLWASPSSALSTIEASSNASWASLLLHTVGGVEKGLEPLPLEAHNQGCVSNQATQH